MVGHGGSSAGSYLADPTSPIPSHCASVVLTSTLRVNHSFMSHFYSPLNHSWNTLIVVQSILSLSSFCNFLHPLPFLLSLIWCFHSIDHIICSLPSLSFLLSPFIDDPFLLASLLPPLTLYHLSCCILCFAVAILHSFPYSNASFTGYCVGWGNIYFLRDQSAYFYILVHTCNSWGFVVEMFCWCFLH